MKSVALIITLFFIISISSFSQCTVSHSGGTMGVVFGLWGQGFTATCNGFIDYVGFISANSGVVQGDTLYIYNGNGTSGIPIHQQYFNSINVANNGDLLLIHLNGSVPVVNGNQYTMEFNPGPIILRGSNNYSGGEAFLNGSSAGLDVDFVVGVTSSVGVKGRSLGYMNIYPSPTSGPITISLKVELTGSLAIRDVLGKLVLQEKFMNLKDINIRLNGPAGIYFIQLEVDGQVITKKVFKN